MNIVEYQEQSKRTVNISLSKEQLVSNMVFGINGETGEVTDILKKHLYHSHELDLQHLKEELGDIMFYLVNLATIYKIDFSEVLQINVDKLLKRYPNGFDKNKSINRDKEN
jgi:NTP pyrophosphatase (non-canonical NTP hydrolase)